MVLSLRSLLYLRGLFLSEWSLNDTTWSPKWLDDLLDVYGEVVCNVQSGLDSPVQSGGLGPLLDRFLVVVTLLLGLGRHFMTWVDGCIRF